jgi:hypothetical protein
MSDPFRTQRLSALRGASPTYIPGEFVYLQKDVEGAARGTYAKIVSVQATRPGEHRYQLLVSEEKLWVFEADIRPTPPSELGEPGEVFSMTQRMQTLTLSQRMNLMGANNAAVSQRMTTLNATQRMHTLSQTERMQEMLKTNRMKVIPAKEEPEGSA